MIVFLVRDSTDHLTVLHAGANIQRLGVEPVGKHSAG
jgi:hypothetical protein